MREFAHSRHFNDTLFGVCVEDDILSVSLNIHGGYDHERRQKQ